jgi:hypothetical protein
MAEIYARHIFYMIPDFPILLGTSIRQFVLPSIFQKHTHPISAASSFPPITLSQQEGTVQQSLSHSKFYPYRLTYYDSDAASDLVHELKSHAIIIYGRATTTFF